MTAPPTFRSTDPLHRLTITLTDRQFRTLEGMARGAGRATSVQAQLLFEAAFSARCKPTGDAALDEAVAAIDAEGGGIVPPDLAPKVLGFLAKAESAPHGVTLPEIITAPAPRVLTAREAGHEAIVARARMAVPADLGRLKDPAPLPPAKPQEDDHGHDDARPEPVESAAPVDPDSREPAAETGSAAAVDDPAAAPQAQADGDQPAVSGEAGEQVAHPPASPPPPAAAPAAPLISAATLKYMRMLKSIGNTPAEIADMVGLTEAAVRAALGGKP